MVVFEKSRLGLYVVAHSDEVARQFERVEHLEALNRVVGKVVSSKS